MYIATYSYWSTGPFVSLASPAIPMRYLPSLRHRARVLLLFLYSTLVFTCCRRVTSVYSSITVLANVAKCFWMAPENVGGTIRKYVTIVALTT